MRVLVAPDSFAGTLSAAEAALAIEEGWRLTAPGDVVERLPLSDGGPGFVDVLAERLGGQLLARTVMGPLGGPVPATILLTAEGTAYVEAAQACGLDLLAPPQRDPRWTTTVGVGELIASAVDAGARRVVVGLGGSATNDGGAGALAALGAEPAALLRRGGLALAELAQPAVRGEPGDTGRPGEPRVDLEPARRRLGDVELVLASDVDHRLLGPNGATATFAPQKGADRAAVAALDDALGVWARLTDSRLVGSAGSGAAGGLGFGLLLLGGRREPGSTLVGRLLGIDERIAAADLVVTGEGCFDHQSLRGKVVAGVADRAMAQGRPVIVLAGRVEVGRREMQAVGVESAYAVLESAVAPAPGRSAPLPERPAEALAALASRVARTWSPPR